MSILAINDKSFESEVVNSELPVLIDFWAEWCGPCKQIGPILEQISDEKKDLINIYKLNVDENPVTPQKYGVRGLKPEGTGSKYTFELGKEAESEIARVSVNAIEEGKRLNKLAEEIFPNIEKNFLTRTGRKMTAVEKTAMESKFFKDLDDLLRVEGTDAKSILKPAAIRHKGALLAKRRALVPAADPKNIARLKDELKALNAKTRTIQYTDDLKKHQGKIKEVQTKLKRAEEAADILKRIDREGGGVFKISDYDINLSPQWKSIVKQIEAAGGKVDEVADVIVNMRAGIDNMSARLLGREMPEEINRIITDSISDYFFITEESGKENLLKELLDCQVILLR